MSECAVEHGGKVDTIESYQDALTCDRCGVKVRWDLAEDALFGFEAACPEKLSTQTEF